MINTSTKEISNFFVRTAGFAAAAILLRTFYLFSYETNPHALDMSITIVYILLCLVIIADGILSVKNFKPFIKTDTSFRNCSKASVITEMLLGAVFVIYGLICFALDMFSYYNVEIYSVLLDVLCVVSGAVFAADSISQLNKGTPISGMLMNIPLVWAAVMSFVAMITIPVSSSPNSDISRLCTAAAVTLLLYCFSQQESGAADEISLRIKTFTFACVPTLLIVFTLPMSIFMLWGKGEIGYTIPYAPALMLSIYVLVLVCTRMNMHKKEV